MDEKPIAGIATAMVVAPFVILCCLGPVVIGSIVGGVVAWLGGLGPAEIAGAAIVLATVAYGLLRWRRTWLRRAGTQDECGACGSAVAPDGRSEKAAPNLSQPLPMGREPERAHPAAKRARSDELVR